MVTDWIQAISTVVLAVVTCKYMRLTRDLVLETRRARRPRVSVDVQRDSNFDVFLVVKNEGSSPARNLVFEVKAPFKSGSGRQVLQYDLQDFGWVRDGFARLGIAEVHRYPLGAPQPASTEALCGHAMRAVLSVTYEGAESPEAAPDKYTDEFELDVCRLLHGKEYVA